MKDGELVKKFKEEEEDALKTGEVTENLDEVERLERKERWKREEIPLCTECGKVHTRNGVCKNCKVKPKLTSDEQAYVDKLKYEIETHTVKLILKEDKPPVGWDLSKDEDYWGRRNKISELAAFGKMMKIWIWNGVPMYCNRVREYCINPATDCPGCLIKRNCKGT